MTMPSVPSQKPVVLSQQQARRIWLNAQRLDTTMPFGDGPEATRQAVAHLGYVQIDTINVIERCHHHILFTRIPGYRRAHLNQAQSVEKSVFEYWTHALSYVPTQDVRFYLPEMRRHRRLPDRRFEGVTRADLRKLLDRIRTDGPLTIRDIDDDVLVEKTHPWASRKPSKRALQLAFFSGDLTINARAGMLKSYDLMDRHFGWSAPPVPATERDVTTFRLERALRAQGIVSVDSVCYLDAKRKSTLRGLIERRVRDKVLVPVRISGAEDVEHWLRPELLERDTVPAAEPVHILSPFDPLVIQRKRLQQFFGYEHRFEAYVPKSKRVLGYFALPVLIGDTIVAAIDLKTDRVRRKLVIQQLTWTGRGPRKDHKRMLDEELHRFEQFQLAYPSPD